MRNNYKGAFVLIGLLGLIGLGVGLVSGQTVATVKNYYSLCSGALPCDNKINVNGSIEHNGVAMKMARGTVTLDGTNPSSVATGLETIVHCFVTNKRTTAPGDETSVFTWGNTGATLDVYAWVHAAADPTRTR